MPTIVLTERDRERFEKYVYPDPNSGCFIWAGSCKSGGYGYTWLLRRPSTLNKKILAHRLAWLLDGRVIPEGLCVLHKCDTPSCVNPGHLFLGTQADNMRDMAKKGRGRGHVASSVAPGVSLRHGKFSARLGRRRLGRYATASEAIAVVETARSQL